MPSNGDPHYLDLLQDQQTILLFEDTPFRHEAELWSRFDQEWEALNIENASFEIDLFNSATTALNLYCLKNKQDPVTVIEAMRSLHIRKNAGYAGHDQDDAWLNFRGSVKWGVPVAEGVLVRLGDKYIRTVNLRRDPRNEQVGESLLDSLADYAAYALIALCILQEERNTAIARNQET